MKLVNVLMQHTGKPIEQCVDECPYNYMEDVALKIHFIPYCDEDGGGCETCLSQRVIYKRET